MFKISVSPEEIEKLPLGSFPGRIVVIDRPGLEYNSAIMYLRRQSVIGFDTETRPVFSPGQKPCHVALLQLSGPEKAFLFRVNTLGMRRRLRKILSNPQIVKVGAAVHDDVRGLRYYADFEPGGFVDLQKIAWQWGIKDKSVKKLAANILGCRISKSQQLSNWEAPELDAAQRMYAATDAWVCLEMYRRLLSLPKNPLSPEQLAPQPQPQPQPQQSQPQPQSRSQSQHRQSLSQPQSRQSEPRLQQLQSLSEPQQSLPQPQPRQSKPRSRTGHIKKNGEYGKDNA